jgi:hypothetical protein
LKSRGLPAAVQENLRSVSDWENTVASIRVAERRAAPEHVLVAYRW